MIKHGKLFFWKYHIIVDVIGFNNNYDLNGNVGKLH